MTGESEAPSDSPHHDLIESTNERLDRLTHPLGPGGDWPLEVFPPEVAAYIATSAVSARVPQAMVALPFLVFTGATIGRQLKLHVGNGWMESPTLWATLIAPTGSGKTPAIEWARRPLDRLQEAAALGGTWKRANPDLTFATGHTIDSLARDLVQTPGLILVRDELHSLVRAIGQHTAAASIAPITSGSPSGRATPSSPPAPTASTATSAPPSSASAAASNPTSGGSSARNRWTAPSNASSPSSPISPRATGSNRSGAR